MINWSNLLDSNPTAMRLVEEFAKGNISRDNMLRKVPSLREEIRSRGVNEMRRLARKSLRRRGVQV